MKLINHVYIIILNSKSISKIAKTGKKEMKLTQGNLVSIKFCFICEKKTFSATWTELCNSQYRRRTWTIFLQLDCELYSLLCQRLRVFIFNIYLFCFIFLFLSPPPSLSFCKVLLWKRVRTPNMFINFQFGWNKMVDV